MFKEMVSTSEREGLLYFRYIPDMEFKLKHMNECKRWSALCSDCSASFAFISTASSGPSKANEVADLIWAIRNSINFAIEEL